MLFQDRYVQDERYVAGAGMRRSDFFQVGTVLWKSGPSPQRGFASHIPVLSQSTVHPEHNDVS